MVAAGFLPRKRLADRFRPAPARARSRGLPTGIGTGFTELRRVDTGIGPVAGGTVGVETGADLRA